MEGQGLPFPLAAENDLIFGLERYSFHCCGGLLGIEVKRVVNYAAAFRQTVVEWLVLSNNSWFPCVQVSFFRFERERNDDDEALRTAGRF